MLAKVICHGKTREDARHNLIEALNGYHIEGVSTNIDFATSVLCLPEFAEGNLSTGFIEQHFDGGIAKRSPAMHSLRLAALVATLIYHTREVAVRESMRHIVITSYSIHYTKLYDAAQVVLDQTIKHRHERLIR